MPDNIKIPDKRDIKAEAKRMLAKKGVLLRLIFAIILCGLVFMAVELSEALCYYLALYFVPSLSGAEAFDAVLTFSFDAVSLLCMAPVIMGGYRLASALAAGDDPRMTEMFYYLKPQRYGRALLAVLIVSAPIMLYGYAVTLLSSLFSYFESFVGSSTLAAFIYGMYAFMLGLLMVAAAVALLLPYCRLFSVIAAVINGEGQPVGKCIKAALRATEGRAVGIFVFRASFVPLCLLSLLTVGMLFVIFTGPYMLISYFYYNAALFGKEPRAARTTEVTFDER